MSEEQGTLAALAGLLADAVRPLEEAFADPERFEALMLSLGFGAPGLPPSYLAVAEAATDVLKAVEELPAEPGPADWLGVLARSGSVFDAVSALTEAPAGLDPGQFLPELARRLPEYLLAEELRRSAPAWYSSLALLGVIQAESHPGEGEVPPFTRIHFDWAQIPARLGDPGSLPRLLWGWGTDDLDLTIVFEALSELVESLGLPTSLDRLSDGQAAVLQDGAAVPPVQAARDGLTVLLADPEIAGQRFDLGVQLVELPPEGPAPAGLALRPIVPSGLEEEIDLGGGWVFGVRVGTDLGQQFAVVARPGELLLRFPGAPGQALPSAGFGVSLKLAPEQPVLLFGQPAQTRLQLTGAALGARLDLHGTDLELGFSVGLEGLALIISAGGADGFLGSVLGGQELTIDVPFELAWTSATGFSLKTRAGFDLTVHPGIDLGLIAFDRVDLALHLDVGSGAGPPALVVRVAAAFSGKLGPFSYAVDRLGVELPVSFAPGNAGPFDLSLRPAWPTGLGLAIKTPAVSGGGFLSLDPEAGRYAGIFELTIVGTVSVKVIGIITTKLPDGSPGFALLIIITADGFTPVQLGMGFVLTGIGGLIALNRTIDVEAVRGGLSSGVLDSVLFAKNPVANAERILSTLETIFPLAPDRLLVGPLVEIGWGSPPVVKVRLALLLELPQPLRAVLLAALAVTLPTADKAVVELHVDAIGVLDLSKGELALDASLHHSRLWKFTLTGDLALRLNWGDDPMFLLSVGGFHPRFTPPAGLRALQRLTFSLSDSENPKIRFQTYFAVTANTIQLGARVEIAASVGGFGLSGGGAFDALVQWVPFGVDVIFQAWVKITAGGSTLLAAQVEVEITGPQPWHVVGSVSFSILWFSVSVGIDFTVGDPLAPVALAAVDVVALLWAEITRAESWSAALPAAVTPGVTLGGGTHPLAVISVRQKVVPLGTLVTRVGAQHPAAGPRAYDLDVEAAGGLAAVALTEEFAPAQFSEQTEDEKLTRPSFVSLPAGLSFRSTGAAAPLERAVSTDLSFESLELTTLDKPATPTAPRAVATTGHLLAELPRPAADAAEVARTAVIAS